MTPRRFVSLVLVVCAVTAATGVANAQARRAPARPRAKTVPAPAPAPALRTEPATMVCPSVLGDGVRTKRRFCDVLTGHDPKDGIVIALPPHDGPVTLTFDLHNRHTYSEELTKAKRAFGRYTATIGVLTADNTLLTRAVVQSEFRVTEDLLDRVPGGAGPGGLKAVAPAGSAAISVEIPAEEVSVSLLGEKLSVLRIDGVDNFSAAGRPIALVSNVSVQYRPPVPTPPKRSPTPRRR